MTQPATSPAPSGRRPLQRHKRLLTRAMQDPKTVLRDRRCLKPAFCRAFFDHCHDMALRDRERALELAPVAAELAQKTQDPHLVHLAEGVWVHTLIADQRRARAAEVLEDYRLSASTCCEACAADWHLRHGDLLVEDHRPRAGGEALERSIEKLGVESGDSYARVSYVRGVEHLYKGDRNGALAAARTTVQEIDLSSPKGYVLDTVALIACYLQRGGERRHDEQAREILDLLRQRLKGVEGFTGVRTWHGWVDGAVSARLGDWRRANDHLNQARKALVKTGPPNHALAAALDYCTLLSWRLHDGTRREILQILRYAKRVLDLEPAMAKGLHQIIQVISEQPRRTLLALKSLRGSFIVPVPGIVERAKRLSEWRKEWEQGGSEPGQRQV